MSSLKPYLTLCRVPLSLFAALSAATGFLLAPHHPLPLLLITTGAVFLLACGASAMNQYQERDIDALMERTRQRPLPSGDMLPSFALVASVLLMLAGLLVLAFSTGLAAAGLGALAIAWYNGVYTNLKRMTAFAAVPGAVVGMLPPAIGWISAGGSISDPRLVVVCFLFFLWQTPHFWLLLLHLGEDYERAGLPSLFTVMSKPQVARMTFVWIFAAAVASLLLPLFGAVRGAVVSYAFLPIVVWLLWSARSLVVRQPAASPSPLLFRKINLYLLLIMSLLALENLFFTLP